MRSRILQAELLDSLPPDHPDALHNRRDLRLTNALMGNPRWFVRSLPSLLQTDDRVLEIGAGTGELGLRLNRRHIPTAGLDLWPRPPAWPESRAWHQTDLRTFSEWERYPVIIGNLIFHQFSDEELLALGTRLQSHARVIVACEPARRRVFQAAYKIFGPPLGANHVSLHDAHVSIAAGFLANELPHRLGLDSSQWDCYCTTTLLGAYRMIARRRP